MASKSKAPAEIDGAHALSLLQEVVAERPDYVYERPVADSPQCLYVLDNEPSCLVAQVLHRAGYSVETLSGLDGQGPISDAVREVPAIVLTGDAAAILEAAQGAQDDGETWGDALAVARREASRRGISA